MLSYRKKLNRAIKTRRLLKNYRIPLTSRKRRRKIVRRIRPAISAMYLKAKKKAKLKTKKLTNFQKGKVIKKESLGHLHTPDLITKILFIGKSKINMRSLREYKFAVKDRIFTEKPTYLYKKKWYVLRPLENGEKEFNWNLAERLLRTVYLTHDLEREVSLEDEEFVDVLFDDEEDREDERKIIKARDPSELIKRKSILYRRNSYLLQVEGEERSKKQLKNMLLLDILMAAKLEMGERISTKNKNEKIKNYFMGIRNDYAIYNMNLIIIGLRLTLGAITSRIKYKKRTLINYSNPRNHGNFHLSYTPIHEYPKDLFLVTWKKWIGGILTNFKRLSKRIISRMNHEKQKNKDNNKLGKEDILEDYRIAFPRDVPKLPAFVVSTTDCHWTLNESKRMKIHTTQLIEISHLGYFGDINLALNTHYLGLRSFTSILQECILHVQRNARLLHKGKIHTMLDITTLGLARSQQRSRGIAKKFASKCDVSNLFKRDNTVTLSSYPQNSNISKPLENPWTYDDKPQPLVNNPVVSKVKPRERMIQSPDRFQFPDRIQRLGGYLSWDKIKKNPEKYAFNVNMKIYD